MIPTRPRRVRLETAALQMRRTRPGAPRAPVDPASSRSNEYESFMMNSRTRNSRRAAGARRVLSSKVVPELRQLLVRLQLARVERHRLFVREREHVVAPGAVL